MFTRRHFLAWGAVGVLAWSVSPALASGFVNPTGWTPGGPGSTYQEWRFFAADTGNEPDFGRITDGTPLPLPTVSVTPPAFATSSGNFYAFGGGYSVSAEVPNYGSGPGTHVIVQVEATVNPDPTVGGPASVMVDTLRLEDGAGNVLTGGANAEALQEALLGTGTGVGPLGQVTIEFLIWEFFLPGHATDFQIVSDSLVHSSFAALRIDTQITETPFPIIPEPSSLVLLGILGLLARRR